MSKCKGTFGKLLGHRWETTATPVAADHNGPGVFFMHGVGPLMIKRVTTCKRCRAVKAEE